MLPVGVPMDPDGPARSFDLIVMMSRNVMLCMHTIDELTQGLSVFLSILLLRLASRVLSMSYDEL
jgi:hypothetical protein